MFLYRVSQRGTQRRGEFTPKLRQELTDSDIEPLLPSERYRVNLMGLSMAQSQVKSPRVDHRCLGEFGFEGTPSPLVAAMLELRRQLDHTCCGSGLGNRRVPHGCLLEPVVDHVLEQVLEAAVSEDFILELIFNSAVHLFRPLTSTRGVGGPSSRTQPDARTEALTSARTSARCATGVLVFVASPSAVSCFEWGIWRSGAHLWNPSGVLVRAI